MGPSGLMYVCYCRGVTDGSICAAIQAGARDPETLARRCGAGDNCGGCLPALRALLASYDVHDEPVRTCAVGSG